MGWECASEHSFQFRIFRQDRIAEISAQGAVGIADTKRYENEGLYEDEDTDYEDEYEANDSDYIDDDEDDDENSLWDDVEADADENPIEDDGDDTGDEPPERKLLKRELRAQALKRLEDSARTLNDYENLVAWYDRLDANRQRRERYYELFRSGDDVNRQADGCQYELPERIHRALRMDKATVH